MTLTESAWAGSKKKDSYLNSKYHRLAGRRGKKRALVAIGHKILIMSYYILKNKVGYKEIGISYLDEKRRKKIAGSYRKILLNLGYDVVFLKKVA
ncbi:MAG: hypothetical protein AB1422_02615 [bacterium]